MSRRKMSTHVNTSTPKEVEQFRTFSERVDRLERAALALAAMSWLTNPPREQAAGKEDPK